MSPNQKSTFTPPANPSDAGSPDWIYNEIMRHIEPDLMTNILPKHVEMYAKETSEQRLARMKAYDEAFAIFDKVADEQEKEMHEEVKKLKTEARKEAMTKEKKEEEKEVEKIEEEMDASSNDQ